MTGIILAGGKNSRMGKNKAFLSIGDATIIERILAVYRKIFDEIIIVTNSPEDYEGYNVKLAVDIVKSCGPLGGIYTGLFTAKHEYCFVTACDMPFIDENIIKNIIAVKGYDIVVPSDHGHYEPLFAMYSKICLDVLWKQIQLGKLGVKDVFKLCSVRELKVELLWEANNKAFINVNTPKEYKNALKLEENMGRCEYV